MNPIQGCQEFIMLRLFTASILAVSAVAFTQVSFARDSYEQNYKLVNQNHAVMERFQQAQQTQKAQQDQQVSQR
jgi:hypothetical protein